MELEKFRYDNQIVRMFLFATVTCVVGMLVEAYRIAASVPGLNLGVPFTTFGRLRPLHTNAVVSRLSGTESSSVLHMIQRF